MDDTEGSLGSSTSISFVSADGATNSGLAGAEWSNAAILAFTAGPSVPVEGAAATALSEDATALAAAAAAAAGGGVEGGASPACSHNPGHDEHDDDAGGQRREEEEGQEEEEEAGVEDAEGRGYGKRGRGGKEEDVVHRKWREDEAGNGNHRVPNIEDTEAM